VFKRAWLSAEEPIPIYGKEMRALVESLWATREELFGSTVVCAVDNSAVVSAVRHRYSRCPRLREGILQIQDFEVQTNSRVITVQTPSKKNGADEPSRNAALHIDRCNECRTWLQASVAAVK
jgi:hypothetical protein